MDVKKGYWLLYDTNATIEYLKANNPELLSRAAPLPVAAFDSSIKNSLNMTREYLNATDQLSSGGVHGIFIPAFMVGVFIVACYFGWRFMNYKELVEYNKNRRFDMARAAMTDAEFSEYANEVAKGETALAQNKKGSELEETIKSVLLYLTPLTVFGGYKLIKG